MAKYRTIRMSFWVDPFIEELQAEKKLLYIYLITCPHATNLGIMDTSTRKIAFETGLEIEKVTAHLTSLEQAGKIVIDNTKILMVNFVKHQSSTSPKLLKELEGLFFEEGSLKIREALCIAYPTIFTQSDPISKKNSTLSKIVSSSTNSTDTPFVPSPTRADPIDTLSVPYANSMDTLGIPSGEREEEEEREREKEKEERIFSASASLDAALAPSGELPLAGKKKKLTGKRKETFLEFWDSFGDKRGKAEAVDAWANIPTLTEALVAEIVAGAKAYAQKREHILAAGGTPKMAQGWLSGRRWEDSPPDKTQTEPVTAAILDAEYAKRFSFTIPDTPDLRDFSTIRDPVRCSLRQ